MIGQVTWLWINESVCKRVNANELKKHDQCVCQPLAEYVPVWRRITTTTQNQCKRISETDQCKRISVNGSV